MFLGITTFRSSFTPGEEFCGIWSRNVLQVPFLLIVLQGWDSLVESIVFSSET